MLKFKQTNFLTFTSFHNHYKFLIKDLIDGNIISVTDSNKLYDLIDIILIDLQLLFALNFDDGLKLILEYYDLEEEEIINMHRLLNFYYNYFNFTGC
jgi:hypothetical protein